MPPRFQWITFDVNDLLPSGWQQQVASLADNTDCRMFPRTPVLSREAPDVAHIFRGRVHADQTRLQLPWLHELYGGAFLELACEASRTIPPRRASPRSNGIARSSGPTRGTWSSLTHGTTRTTSGPCGQNPTLECSLT